MSYFEDYSFCLFLFLNVSTFQKKENIFVRFVRKESSSQIPCLYNCVIRQMTIYLYDWYRKATTNKQLGSLSLFVSYKYYNILHFSCFDKCIDTFIDSLCSKQLSIAHRKVTLTNISLLLVLHIAQKRWRMRYR